MKTFDAKSIARSFGFTLPPDPNRKAAIAYADHKLFLESTVRRPSTFADECIREAGATQ